MVNKQVTFFLLANCIILSFVLVKSSTKDTLAFEIELKSNITSAHLIYTNSIETSGWC